MVVVFLIVLEEVFKCYDFMLCVCIYYLSVFGDDLLWMFIVLILVIWVVLKKSGFDLVWIDVVELNEVFVLVV